MLSLIDVNPFGNYLCTIKVTGQDLIDMFEYFVSLVKGVYEENGQAVEKFGSFQKISGMKIVVDTTIPSSVLMDSEDETFISIGEARRLVSLFVLLSNGTYAPENPEET